MNDERGRSVFLGRAVLPAESVPPSTVSTELARVQSMLENVQNAPLSAASSQQYLVLVDRAMELQRAIETHGADYSLAEHLGLRRP